MKKLITLCLTLLSLSSCSQKLLRFKVIKKDPVKEKTIQIPKLNKGEQGIHSEKNWFALLFISNNSSGVKPHQELAKLCNNSDYITNSELNYSWFMVPIVYFHMNFDYTGDCHE